MSRVEKQKRDLRHKIYSDSLLLSAKHECILSEPISTILLIVHFITKHKHRHRAKK